MSISRIYNETKYQLLQIFVQRKIKGTKRPHKQKFTQMDNIGKWFNITTPIFHMVNNKEDFKKNEIQQILILTQL